MDPYNEEIRHYEDAAHENFDNFEPGFDGVDAFDGYDSDYEEVEYVTDPYEEAGYDNYSANSIGTIDPNDRTYTIRIENTGTEPAEIVIFGANEAKEQPPLTSVEVMESSHNEARQESQSNPFQISGMKMVVSSAAQFDNIWQITRRSSTGTHTTRPYQPRNASSPQNQDPLMVDDHSFSVDITGMDSIRFLQNPGSTTLTLTVKARANMGNLLKGQNVAEMTNIPRTTGLPQFDINQQKQGLPFGLQAGKKVRKVVRRKSGSDGGMDRSSPGRSRQSVSRGRSNRRKR